jgi:hypothetical protein
MKKWFITISIVATIVISLVSCSKDDDKNNCDSCLAQGSKIEICDNGDDTFTLSAGGQSETVTAAELEGIAPDEFIGLICDLSNLTP